jgi:hypothetical protein
MKSKFHILIPGLSVLVILALGSCMKDNPATFDFNTAGSSFSQLNSSNMLNTTVNGGATVANVNSYFMILRADSSYQANDSFQIELGGTAISRDVTVTIGLDTTGFNSFNSSNGGGYQMLPASDYTFHSNSTVMPAGSRAASINIGFNTRLIDFSKPYILPIIIKDAQGYAISGNFGSVMYRIVPGNQFMGLYQSTGQRVMGGNTYTIKDLKYLYDLSGITSVQGSYPTAGGHGVTVPAVFVPGAVVANAADQSIYLAVGQQMDLTVNPDNSVTVSNDNLYGFGIFTYTLIPGPSTYDAASHVFNLNYGFRDPFSGDTSVVKEVIKRVR